MSLITEQRSHSDAMRRRTKIARRVIAAFLLLMSATQLMTFLSRAATEKADEHAGRFTNIATLGADYVRVHAEVVDISPASTSESVVLTVTPHGTYSDGNGGLAQPLEIDVDGVPGGSVTLPANELPLPVQLSLDLEGDPTQYPFDSYTSILDLRLTSKGETVPTEVDVASARHDWSTSEVPTELTIGSTRHDWKTTTARAEEADGSIEVTLGAKRGSAVLGFALFELGIMILLATLAVALIYSELIGGKQLDFGYFFFLIACLFALPGIRNSLPGVPSLGTVADYAVFFWCLAAVAGAMLTAAVAFLRAAAKARAQGEPAAD